MISITQIGITNIIKNCDAILNANNKSIDYLTPNQKKLNNATKNVKMLFQDKLEVAELVRAYAHEGTSLQLTICEIDALRAMDKLVVHVEHVKAEKKFASAIDNALMLG